MQFIDFFSGIGGMRLGLEQAGNSVTVNVSRAIGFKLKKIESECA